MVNILIGGVRHSEDFMSRLLLLQRPISRSLAAPEVTDLAMLSGFGSHDWLNRIENLFADKPVHTSTHFNCGFSRMPKFSFKRRRRLKSNKQSFPYSWICHFIKKQNKEAVFS